MFRLPIILTVCFTLGLVARPASAQTNGTGVHASNGSTRRAGFLTGYRFHLDATRMISSEDRRFTWDADIGADIDLFDLSVARGNLFANFESILGEELRAVDPNQGNYTIDLSLWWRLGRGELGAIFHHVSRHLSDRGNPYGIAWNMLGLEYAQPMHLGRWSVDLGLRGFRTLQRSFVDYAGEAGAYGTIARPIGGRRVAWILGFEYIVVPVVDTPLSRDTLIGGRLETGVRIGGRAGAVELYAARERRIDAHPFDIHPIYWTQIGFRFVTR